MIEVLIYYAIFALTTGIFSVYNLFVPSLRILNHRKNTTHVFITNKVLSGIVFLVLCTFLAPWFVASIVSHNKKVKFIQGFLEEDD